MDERSYDEPQMLHEPWKDGLAAFGLAALTVVFFWKILLTNLILVGLDIFTYFYPYREYAAEAWRQGRIPLWNPYLFMGVPFLANIQAAVFYPFNIALAWLTTPQSANLSIALHIFLAGLFTYLFARRSLGLGPYSSFLAACCFALGGYLGAQVEHINQLNVTIWFPLLLLLLDSAWIERQPIGPDTALSEGGKGRRWIARLRAALGASVLVAFQILAGHSQALYITLLGAALYAVLLPALRVIVNPDARLSLPHQSPSATGHLLGGVVDAVSRLLWLAGSVAIGGLLSAAQLLPTLELANLSYRSGGLPYREAVSFSLRPQWLLQSLLPPYHLDMSQTFGASFGEYVAYVGTLGLLIAVMGWLWGYDSHRHAFGLLAVVGFFLGLGGYNPFYYLLYRLVPGFALFRAPVRWMVLYSFAVSILVGYGVQLLFSPDCITRVRASASAFIRHLRTGRLASIAAMAMLASVALFVYFLDFPGAETVVIWLGCFVAGPMAIAVIAMRRLPRPLGQSVLAAALLGELFIASRGLAYNTPTAPQAWDFLRPAPAFLLTDPGEHRFISMSGITYDPGELKEIMDIYGWQLPERAVYDYVICVKLKEVLAFNLPLHFRLHVVDGYDGGLLPLKRFVRLQELFLPKDSVSADGRLREQLQEVPNSRLLSLLNVKYVVTDKVYDVWIDDVFYDLQFTAKLGPGLAQMVSTQDILPDPATAIGLISHLRGAADLPDDTPVAEVVVIDAAGTETRHLLRAGRETAEGEYGQSGTVNHARARIGHVWRDNPNGNDYVAVFDFERPRVVKEIAVHNRLTRGEFNLRGVSLIDRGTMSNRTVLLSTSGRFRLVYSGDVKIYENLDNLPRAFVVHQAKVIADDAETIVAIRDRSFDPASTVILAEPTETETKRVARETDPMAQQAKTNVDSVTIVSYAPEHVLLDVETSAAGYLVLTDTDYPGWEAKVDGQRMPIYRANLMCRAIKLEQGRHQVEFRYRPRVFYAGAAISLGSLAALISGLVCLALLTRCN